MSISKKLLKHLETNKIKFKVLQHKFVFTAHDAAQTLRKKLNELAKTLLVKTEKGYAIVVLPASHIVDFKKLKKALKAKKVEITKEGAMKKLLNIDSGEITPFAVLYTIKKKGQEILPVYVDAGLLKLKKFITKADSYTDSIEMSVQNFIKATNAQKANIAIKRPKKR